MKIPSLPRYSILERKLLFPSRRILRPKMCGDVPSPSVEEVCVCVCRVRARARVLYWVVPATMPRDRTALIEARERKMRRREIFRVRRSTKKRNERREVIWIHTDQFLDHVER